MTVGQIKTMVASLLHRPTTDFVKGTGANEVDLLLVALNNARKKAERAHDFSVCRQRGYLSVLNDSDWEASVTWFDGGDWVTRKVQTWFLRTEGDENDGEFGGTDVVLRAVSRDQLTKLYEREGYRNASLIGAQRYLSDAQVPVYEQPLLGQTYAVIRGRNVGIHPQPTTAQLMLLDAFVWWPNFTADDDDDWFTDNGQEFLIHQGTVEANNLVKHFVGNAEGNLPPPSKQADEALAQLIQLDIDAQEGSITVTDY